MVGVDKIDPHPVECVIGRLVVRSAPETDRFPDSMAGIYCCSNSFIIRLIHLTATIPILCMALEIGADHGYPFKLAGSVKQFSILEIPIEPDPRWPLPKIIRRRNGSGDHKTDSVLNCEHIFEFLSDGNDSRQGFCGLDIDHKLQASVTALPETSTIGTEKRNYRLDVHGTEVTLWCEVFAVVGNEDLSVLQVYIRLDRSTAL